MRTKTPDPAVKHAADAMCESADSTAGELQKNEVGITGWAIRVLSGAEKHEETTQRKNAEGVYVLTEEEVQAGWRLREEFFVAPDGYIRRSPVQETLVDPLYHRRIVHRVLLSVFTAAILSVGLYLLISFNLISF